MVQESFVTAFAKLETLREPDRFRSWIVAIAVRYVRKRRRRERFLRALGFHGDELPLDALAAVGTPVEARAELRVLDAALATLPEGHRFAWILRHVEEEPLEAVAEASECSLATAKRWVAAADLVLSRALEHRAHGVNRPRLASVVAERVRT